MKQRTTVHHTRYRKTKNSFPNAATRGYRLNKFIDYLLTGATTLGIVVAILFLVTL